MSYYRIRQTDFNGAQELSVVRAVNKTESLSISVFPNPGRGQFRIEGLKEIHSLRIHDVSGSEVQFRSLGGNRIEIPDALPGIYMAESGGQSVRIVIVP
ncbi:MAG: T9SS type A sorting domain-containing protein [Flavobacteriales bacterium]